MTPILLFTVLSRYRRRSIKTGLFEPIARQPYCSLLRVAILQVCKPEPRSASREWPRVSFYEPRKTLGKKLKNGHNALIMVIYYIRGACVDAKPYKNTRVKWNDLHWMHANFPTRQTDRNFWVVVNECTLKINKTGMERGSQWGSGFYG